jgi:hypothetical protein
MTGKGPLCGAVKEHRGTRKRISVLDEGARKYLAPYNGPLFVIEHRWEA